VSKPPEPPTETHCGPDEHDHRISRDVPVTEAAFERAASIFRAAGDVSRLKLLARLAYGEWCVTELADAAGVGLSTVSQQLRLLRAERLVWRRREGKHIYYGLADTHVLDLVQSALAHASEPSPSLQPPPAEETDEPHEHGPGHAHGVAKGPAPRRAPGRAITPGRKR
jgi:DNA-binding transcriptional ArsR family regulator